MGQNARSFCGVDWLHIYLGLLVINVQMAEMT